MTGGWKNLVPQRLKNIYHLGRAGVSALFFGFPGTKLKIIGVTGTDGKTTVVNLIYHILKQSGFKVSMISTTRAVIGEKELDTGLHVTTPDPIQIQRLLAEMLKVGSEYAVLEVTSHALDQNRVAAVPFFLACVTNITREHLDYHKTYDSYLATKAKLLGRVKFRILNADDSSFEKLKDEGSGQLVSFGLKKEADFSAKKIKSNKGNLEFEVDFKDKKIKVSPNLAGEFNVYNSLAAFAVASTLGVEEKKVAAAISSFPGVVGRMQYIDEGQDFDCVIDFAHTLAALENVLKTLRSQTAGKLIAVFGAAGERDKQKREPMGETAATLATFVVLTSEDPRSERAEDIIEQISAGVEKAGGVFGETYWKITDRKKAIFFALSLAKKGDLVVSFGKGHEKSMNYFGKEVSWDEEKVFKEALKEYKRL